VLRLVDFGGGPQPVPPYVIETISKQLDRLNGANVQHYHNISPGDSVRVKHGPLQDLEMVFIGPSTLSKRVYVLLEILGRLQEVQVDADVLEKAAGNSNVLLDLHTRRVKYTRGKGRKITY
jgi:transcription antitermination factor NusG